ncbi:MAG: CHAT domain-containing protein [Cyanobacteria bacterium P01_F01_bin.56]
MSGEPQQLAEQAQQAYDNGDFLTASQLLNTAITTLEGIPGNATQQAILWGNLSLIEQRRHDVAAALEASANSLSLLGIDVKSREWEEQLAAQLVESPHPVVIAQSLDIYGRLIFTQGNPEDALVSWQYAGQLYQVSAQNTRNSERVQFYRKAFLVNGLNQVQALQTLGRHIRSCGVLKATLNLNGTADTELLDCLQRGGNSFVEAPPKLEALRAHINRTIRDYQLNEDEQTSIWQGLGEILRVLGRLEDSRAVLEDGLTIALIGPEREEPVAQLKSGRFINPNEDKNETVIPQAVSQLVPLYLSLGNTLTALGSLERDRKNSRYENAKSTTSDFGCFYPSLESEGEQRSEDTVAEYYQRAALCYRDAIQRTDAENELNFLKLQAQLNRLNLTIKHFQWLTEDKPTLNATDQGVSSTNRGTLNLDGIIAAQEKSIQSQLAELDCLFAQIEAMPLSQTKVYARLNLAQNILRYLKTKAYTSNSNHALPQLLPDVSQVIQELRNDFPINPNRCGVNHSTTLIRDDDFRQTGGRLLWSDVAYLLRKSISESQALSERTALATPGILSANDPLWEIRTSGNKRIESLAIGNLGHLHEFLAQLYTQAPSQSATATKSTESQTVQQLTQIAQVETLKALELAQPDKAPDIAYQWQWQLGRLLAQQGPTKRNEAIEAYQVAVKTLERARNDLSTIDSEVQFSFRDNVEPVYRELIDLLLQPDPGEKEPNQENLQLAINQMGQLQLAELENFLQCNIPALTPVEEIPDPTAAIIHTILHGSSLTLVVKLPNQKDFISQTQSIDQVELELSVENLFQALSKADIDTAYIEGEKAYNWLVQPIRNILDKHIKDGTLVFVLDSFLRKIPMSFLNNGGNFLIMDYAIAFTPRQEIFSAAASQRKLSVFVGGVGVAQSGVEGKDFAPIRFLNKEIDAIKESGIPVGEPLLDERFTLENLLEELGSGNYSAIHLKTHSEFSSNPNQTFIAAYDDLIKPNDLRGLIQVASESRGEPLDLLVLSACSAAEGDDRAILGLAGIATLTGTRSAISALWSADDEFNTQFMERFYSELSKPNISKAEALQYTQLAFINRNQQHWSNYILVGDWR